MKANEAPEKIYIQSFNVSEEEAKFTSKLFFDDVWTEEPEPGKENIEYIRKDVLIEKACEYLMEYEFNDSPTIADRRKRVDKFIKYMKRE